MSTSARNRFDFSARELVLAAIAACCAIGWAIEFARHRGDRNITHTADMMVFLKLPEFPLLLRREREGSFEYVMVRRPMKANAGEAP